MGPLPGRHWLRLDRSVEPVLVRCPKSDGAGRSARCSTKPTAIGTHFCIAARTTNCRRCRPIRLCLACLASDGSGRHLLFFFVIISISLFFFARRTRIFLRLCCVVVVVVFGRPGFDGLASVLTTGRHGFQATGDVVHRTCAGAQSASEQQHRARRKRGVKPLKINKSPPPP